MITTLLQLGGAIAPPNPGYGGIEIGLPAFLTNLIRLFIVIGGLVLLFNVVIAGIQYTAAAGDPKKVEEAWTKIWQSLLGLVIMISFIIIAGLINKLIFQGSMNILQPKIIGPGTP